MENDQVIGNPERSVTEQLVTVVLCSIAGFVAGKFTEKGVGYALTKFRSR